MVFDYAAKTSQNAVRDLDGHMSEYPTHREAVAQFLTNHAGVSEDRANTLVE